MMQDTFSRYDRIQADIVINSFLAKVYTWMSIGLALTGFVAFFVSHNPVLFNIVSNPIVSIILAISTFGLVFAIAGRIQRMSASTATGLFMIYSTVMGAFLSFIFRVYSGVSISSTFFICAGTFFVVSLYGMATKRDLTSMGHFLMMGLIGIIIASVVNIFFHSSMLYMMISYLGVFIFIGLTAYDTQKLKHMALNQPDDIGEAAIHKGALLGALTLYLDFINLFLFLLQIFGNNRD